MRELPKPKFIFITELAQQIHDEAYGEQRKRTLNLLEEGQRRNRAATFSPAQAEQINALDEVFELAKEITATAFIPPWERKEY